MARAPILVGIDFSDASRVALDAAAALARDLDAALLLVHALPPPLHRRPRSQTPLGQVEAEMNMDEALQFIEEWVRPTRESGLNVEAILGEEGAKDLILRTAEERDVALVVLGRQGWGRLERLRLGSVTAAIAAQSPRPVMLVPFA